MWTAANVIWAGDSFFEPERVGDQLVIIGGGQVGCETGVHYGMNGKQVTILEMQPKLAPDAMRTYQEELEGQVHDHCTAILHAPRSRRSKATASLMKTAADRRTRFPLTR